VGFVGREAQPAGRPASQRLLDRRLGLAAAILMAVIEGRQD